MATFDIDAELEAIVRALTARRLPYAVCGGIAVAVHGHPRATTDIDIIVAAETVDAVVETVRGLGYTLEAAPMRFSSGIEVRRISRVESGELFTLDLMPVTDVLREVWDGRAQVTWRGQPLHIVSREGLIRMKRLASRAQDLADLEALGADDE
jgi:hypothetical protein